MSPETRRSAARLSRRAALGAGSAAAAMGLSQMNHARAQEAGGDLAGHPMVGSWAVLTPDGVIPQTHGPDGSFIAAFPPNYVDPMLGLIFQGSGLGRWEPIDARSGRFTFIQALSDGEGAFLGTWQLAGDIEVHEDGQTWVGTATPHIIVRDKTNAIIFDQVMPAGPQVTATRIGATVESVTLPVATPAATPESTPTA